jgi:Tfp pilus assembly PilM family ATPase
MAAREKDVTVGLELSGQVLRAVRIEHGQDRPRLLALERENLPDDSSIGLDITGSIWKVIKPGRGDCPVVVNIPGSSVQIKKVQVEAAELEYLNDWVRWEAQQYLSGPPEDYLVDFQKLESGEEGLWEILLVMARADVVRERTDLFRTAGFQPAIMDVDALALQNAFEVNYPNILDLPVVLLNVERDYFTMIATRGGIPGDVATFRADRQDPSLCERLLTAISHLQNHWRPEGEAQVQVGKVLLSGDGSGLQEVKDFLSTQCGVEVEVADPFREMAILPILRERLAQVYRPEEFMLATGLALRKT